MRNSITATQSVSFKKLEKKGETITRNAAIAGAIGALASGAASYGIQKDILNTAKKNSGWILNSQKLLKLSSSMNQKVYSMPLITKLISIEKSHKAFSRPAGLINRAVSGTCYNISSFSHNFVETTANKAKVSKSAVAKSAVAAGVVLAGITGIESALFAKKQSK